MNKKSFFNLIFTIVLCELAGVIGSFFTISSLSSWYAQLIKPSFNPPSWIFGPVWTILYALMGIAAFMVWEKGLQKKGVKIALGFFIGQLILNILWSLIFFGAHSPLGSFVEIIFLWIAIFITIIHFYKVSKTSAWLLMPYLLWVSFAMYLNFEILKLN